MQVPGNSDPSVEELVAEGDYQRAAECAEERKLFQRASELFARIWDYESASRCALSAGKLRAALEHAIDGGNAEQIENVTTHLLDTGKQGLAIAASTFEKKQRPNRAASLYESYGDKKRAIELFKSGQDYVQAARLLFELGSDSEAGGLLERTLKGQVEAKEAAQSHSLLGLIYSRRQEGAKAVRHFQQAISLDPEKKQLHISLVQQLFEMGLRDGAREALIAARRRFPELPPSLDDFVSTPTPAVAESKSQLIAGRYELLDQLGSGGSGRVFKARDGAKKRNVAIKLLHAGHTRGTDAYQRFCREARITERLDHDNIVKTHEFSEDAGFLAMEYMDGGSLERRLLERGALPLASCLKIALEILSGIERAHQHGVIHRDIKPANIFFHANGVAKIGDFGTAHLLEFGLTQTGGLIGTLAYISPEQITGANLTVASDYYSLGITLFECCTGRLPFDGPDFIAQHMGASPPDIAELVPDLPAAWNRLLYQLLEKVPEERLASAEVMRKQIGEITKATATRSSVLSLPKRSFDARAEAPTDQPPETQEKKQRYQFVCVLKETKQSSLSSAVDTELARSVIFEEFHNDIVDTPLETHLLSLAKAGGAFLQRVLAYRRDERIAIFEAPAGQPLHVWVKANGPVPAEVAAGMIVKITHSLAAMHAVGIGHGSISDESIVIDELGHPTLLSSGVAVSSPPSSKDDIKALLAIHKTLSPADTPDSKQVAEPEDAASLISYAKSIEHSERCKRLQQAP